MQRKYIVTVGQDGLEEIFTFPMSVNHDCMAEVLGVIKNQTHGDWHRVRRRPVSAGFVTFDGYCSGRSETLNLDSRPEQDTALLGMYS